MCVPGFSFEFLDDYGIVGPPQRGRGEVPREAHNLQTPVRFRSPQHDERLFIGLIQETSCKLACKKARGNSSSYMDSKNDTEKRFIEAYDAYAHALLRYCYFKVSDRYKAEELVEEAFMKTWQYLLKGEEVENIRALLYRVLNNLIIDEYRRKKTSSLDELESEGFELSDTRAHMDLQEQAEINRLLAIVDQLDEKYREAIILRYVDDLAVKEIAEILGESENTVSVRINRAIKQLKKLMKL